MDTCYAVDSSGTVVGSLSYFSTVAQRVAVLSLCKNRTCWLYEMKNQVSTRLRW